MSRPTTQQVHIDKALTDLSLAYTPGIYVGEAVFPTVRVQKISDKYWIYSKEDFLRRDVGLRAPGTRAKRADYGVTTGNYNCVEHAIAKSVPDEVQSNADNPMNPIIDATRYVTEQIYLDKEIDISGDAFGTGWAASATPSASWSASQSTPLADVSTARSTVALAIGREPNTGVMGRALWAATTENRDIMDRLRYSASPNDPAIATVAAVAALFGLQKLLVGTAIYNASLEGVAGSYGFVWGSNLLVAYVAPQPALMTPSAGYIFSATGREISNFREDQERSNVIEARESWDTKIVASDAGYLIKNAA